MQPTVFAQQRVCAAACLCTEHSCHPLPQASPPHPPFVSHSTLHSPPFSPPTNPPCSPATGKSLLELMSNTMEGRLPEAWCVDHLVVPLFTTLAALHATGVAHRDIKPEHIMVDKGATCLLDFHESVQMGNQCLNHRVGQLEYMAPEMADAPSFEDLFHLVSTAWAGYCMRWACRACGWCEAGRVRVLSTSFSGRLTFVCM